MLVCSSSAPTVAVFSYARRLLIPSDHGKPAFCIKYGRKKCKNTKENKKGSGEKRMDSSDDYPSKNKGSR